MSLMCPLWLEQHKVHVPFGHRGTIGEANKGTCQDKKGDMQCPFRAKNFKTCQGTWGT